MRSHGSFSSPTAHIAFCTLDEVLRPHILSIAFSRIALRLLLPDDGGKHIVTSIQLARLFRQHDRYAVADRIGELGGARDQLLLLAVIFERALGERAHEDFKQFRVDARGRTVGCHDRFRMRLHTIARPRSAQSYCSLVSPSFSFLASSISVSATRISARA